MKVGKIFFNYFLLCILLITNLNFIRSEDNFFQAIWLESSSTIQITTATPSIYVKKLKFILKNFLSENERNQWNFDVDSQRNGEVILGYFRELIDHNTNIITMKNENHNSGFDQQVREYLLGFNTLLHNKFFVIEDEDTIAHQVYCENKYSIIFFPNFRQARLYYEDLLDGLSVSNPNKYIALGGGRNGIIDSNDKDFFLKYTSYWCSYRFGIFKSTNLNGIEDFSSNKFNWVYIKDVTGIGYTYLDLMPLESGSLADFSSKKECFFDEFNSDIVFIPTENPHCSTSAWNDKNYVFCYNKKGISNVKPNIIKGTTVDGESVCKKNGRLFFIGKLISQTDITAIEITVSCNSLPASTKTTIASLDLFFSNTALTPVSFDVIDVPCTNANCSDINFSTICKEQDILFTTPPTATETDTDPNITYLPFKISSYTISDSANDDSKYNTVTPIITLAGNWYISS